MFEFQLCAPGKGFPVDALNWYVEEKYNGVRLGVEYTPEGVVGWCRGFFEVQLPNHIVAALPDLPVGTVLDGEYVYGEDEHSAMGALARRRVPPVGQFAAFDIVAPCAWGLRLSSRKRELSKAVYAFSTQAAVFCVEWHEAVPGLAEEVLADVLDNGGEGIVMKRRDSLYSPGRNTTWLKFKKMPG